VRVFRRFDRWFTSEPFAPFPVLVFLVAVPLAGFGGWLISGWLVGLQ